MNKGDLLFVYGTLRRSASADLSNNLGVTYVGEDKIHGALYNLGWFPGVKLPVDDFEPPVLGDVFRIRGQDVAAQLDAYEGYPSLYNRVQVETLLKRRVWVYTYNRDVTEDQRIKTGDWIGYSETVLPRPVNAG